MHNIDWKAQLLNPNDIPMLSHGCGVSQYPQFYDRIKKNQMLPRPYMVSYSGEKGHQCFHKPWILALAISV